MTLDDFKASLNSATSPAGLPPLLLALWHDAKGNWDAAHGVAQDVEDEDGAWVHAYLHRKEGDASFSARRRKTDGANPNHFETSTLTPQYSVMRLDAARWSGERSGSVVAFILAGSRATCASMAAFALLVWSATSVASEAGAVFERVSFSFF